MFTAEELWKAAQYAQDPTSKTPSADKKYWQKLLHDKKYPAEREFFDKWETMAALIKEEGEKKVAATTASSIVDEEGGSSGFASLDPEQRSFFETWAQQLNAKPTLFIKLYFTSPGKKNGT